MPTKLSPRTIALGTVESDSKSIGFCFANPLAKSIHLSPLTCCRFHKYCAVLAWRDGSGILSLPCHFASNRSSNDLGTSLGLTISLLYKMPTGVMRQATNCPSLSLNLAGKFAALAGEN